MILLSFGITLASGQPLAQEVRRSGESAEQVVRRWQEGLCLVADIASRASRISGMAAEQAFGEFYGEPLAEAAGKVGFSACDLLPVPGCWSDVMTFRQRVHLNDDGQAIGCVDITGTRNARQDFTSISVGYQHLDGKWSIENVNKYISLKAHISVSDLLHSFCAPPMTLLQKQAAPPQRAGP